MLVDRTGRKASVRTASEDVALLHEGLENLSDGERALLEGLLNEVALGNLGVISDVSSTLYRTEPVDMQTFLDDPYYMGASTGTLYPKIREDLIEFASTPEVREVVLSGSIGYGKTTIGTLLIAWQLYHLSCMVSPQQYLGIADGSEVAVVVLSRNLPLARAVLKGAVDMKLQMSPYFQEHFPFKIGKDVTQFGKNIRLQIASYASSRVIGTNTFSALLDEVNFETTRKRLIRGGQKRGIADYDRAEKVYRSLLSRIKSRFARAGGALPGLVIMLSSATTEGSFTERKIVEAENNPRIWVRSYAAWDVKPPGTYCGETFQVVVGSSTVRSSVHEVPLTERERQSFLASDCRILDVPIEYLEDFKGDLEAAIRDIAGVSTSAISKFINRTETLELCKDASLVHPFTVDEWTTGRPGAFMWDRLVVPFRRKVVGGFEEVAFRPMREPKAPRWIHVDVALSGDSLGIAMGYSPGMVEVVRRNADGEEYYDLAAEVVVEFMLRVNPPVGEQIFLGDVRSLIYQLQEHGFPIVGVTFDTYQSADMIQQLKQRGLSAKVLSVDRTTVPYDGLKSALYEGRIRYYEYAPFLTEVRALERDETKNKVDHPVAGSKDVADAVAGVVYSLGEYMKSRPIDAAAMFREDRGDEGGDASWVLGHASRPVQQEGRPYAAGDYGLLGFLE